MPVLSHLHHLFNAEQCQAYIRLLRWHDRPLQCPRCQSHHIGQWGTYQYRPGCKRSWCHGCKRTFNDLTATLLHRSTRPLPYWILATFLLCLACSSRRIARELGIHMRTSYRWCWWLRQGELEARKIEVHPYEAERLKSVLSSLRALTLETPEVFLPQAQTRLARCGVALIVLRHLPQTYAHGATFWLTPSKAVVQMSIRGSWADIFWFSLFHELAHVLLHSKRHIFIEGKEGEDPAWRTQEDEANSFAGDVLIPPGPYRAFTGQGMFTAGAIRQFAAQRGIAPGVVVGRLQHDGFIERNQGNGLRERYRWTDA